MVEEAMNPFQVVGQEQALQNWQTILSSGRYGHAHILAGNAGVGKDALALYIAAFVNCRAPDNKPCGECPPCRQLKNLEHPGLHLVFALPRRSANQTDPFAGLKEADMDQINAELAKKIEWPYYHLQIDAANDIRISGIRKLRKDIYLAADPGTIKIVLILRAHKMNVEAANALLKILEEPPASTVFLLTTEYLDRLPDTIRSRCAIHHVPDLSWEVIQKDLLAKHKVNEAQAEISARMAMGNLALAHTYVQQDNRVWLDQIRSTLNALAREDFVSVHKQVLRLKDDPEQTDTTRQQFLSLLILFFRDVAVQLDEEDTAIWVAQVQQMNKLFPSCDPHQAIQAIEWTKDALERKVHLQLALTALFFELRKILRGQSSS